jgi:hypothetical protein
LRIDATHKKWATASGGIFLVASAVYVPYALNGAGGPSGGSAIGLTYGIAGFGLMIFATLLSLRKRFPVWRIGRAQTWMRGHLWLGLLSYPLILFHSGFSMGGALTSALMWIMTIVIITGLLGAALQHFMPKLITQRVPMETIYDQIDRVQAQLLEEADALVKDLDEISVRENVLAVAAATSTGKFRAATGHEVLTKTPLEELRDIYSTRVRPFLSVRGDYRNPLYIRKNAKGMFSRLRALAPAEFHETLDDLENVCEEKRDLDRQSRMHRLLHGWLLVHMPLSFALLLLGGIHAVIALRY